MRLTKEQRAELKALAENDIDGGFVSRYAIEHHHWSQIGTFREALPALLADLEEAEAEIGAANRRAEGAELLAQDSIADLTATRKQLTHWKSNHEAVVKKLRLFTQRDDLPVDRLPAYQHVLDLEKQLAGAQARLAHLVEYWNRDENEMAMKDACWHTVEVAEASDTSALTSAIEAAVEPYRKRAAYLEEIMHVTAEAVLTGSKDDLEIYESINDALTAKEAP